MPFSTIVKKKCKCSPDCPKWPSTSFQGYFYSHAPEAIKIAQGLKAKRTYQAAANRARLSKNSLLSHSLQKDKIMAENGSMEVVNRKLAIDNWFFERRKEMTGICECGCGQKTSKHDDKYFKFSICHVLPKAKFKSIATNKLNFIELSFFGGCHSTLDDMGYEHCMKTKPVLWEKIVAKFKKLYPFIAESEYKSIPNVLLQEINQT